MKDCYEKINGSLTEVPFEVVEDLNLLKINLSNNQIKEIPPFIKRLSLLQKLIISQNSITELPRALGKLVSLTFLDVSHNSLISIHPCVTVLRNLVHLDLSYNLLEFLPADFGSLSCLEQFVCSHNQLKTLPRSIGLCNRLTYLDLSYNLLTELPRELANLSGNLVHLDIFHNRLKNVPPFITAKGTAAILLHLKLNSYDSGSSRAFSPARPLSELKQMKITVHGCKILESNRTWTGPLSSGLYVEVVVDAERGAPSRYRTKTCKNFSEPVWNASFTFLFNPNFKVAAFLYAKMILGPALLVASASIPTSGVTEDTDLSVRLSSGSEGSVGSAILGLKVAIANDSGVPLHPNTSVLSSNVSLDTPLTIRTEAALLSSARVAEAQRGNSEQTFSSMSSSNYSSSRINSSDLPPGWERRVDSQRRIFYVDHNTRTTTWDPPSANELPPGLELRYDHRGRLFYVDHVTRTTSWYRPSLDQEAGLARLNQRSALGALQVTTFPGLERNQTAEVPAIDPATLPLPPYWEERMTPTGIRYYLNHLLQRTQWTDPRSEWFVPTHACRISAYSLRSAQMPLPIGWTQSVTMGGRVFFIDHINRRTQFEDPRLDPTYIEQMEKVNASVPRYIRNFRHKMFLLHQTIEQLQQQGEFKVECRRGSIFSDSYEQIIHAPLLHLHQRLVVSFIGEEGLDYGGISREWFFLLSNEFMNPNYCLFEYATSSRNTLKINSESGINPEHLSYFKFIGRIVGMAVFQRKFIDCGFTLLFYKKLLGRSLQLEDLESLDVAVYKSLKWILKNSLAGLDLGMVFATDYEKFGFIKNIELKPGGAEIEVTDDNKAEYVELMLNFHLNYGTEDQMLAFTRGFEDVISVEKLQMFDERELEVLICGVTEIDVDDWEKNTVLREFARDSKQVIWLWQCVRAWDNDMRVRLLQFVTGSCRVPVGGFKDLQGNNGPQLFCIEKEGHEKALPRSHTWAPPLPKLPPTGEKINTGDRGDARVHTGVK
ncbi:E3 ubiquitin-protein ligase wwp-1-like isoform X3 [Zophobas morio]